MVGGASIIPSVQIEYLVNRNFVVVIPNYRLAPQVTGKEAFGDCEDAYEWATNSLPDILKNKHDLEVDAKRVTAYGHSAGGTLAMHLASTKPLKAITAFYPSLFISDPSSSIAQPTTAPPFGLMPDFQPTDQDWALIAPSSHQVSAVPFPTPGSPPPPRSKWQMSILKNGQWLPAVQPDGDYVSIDPMTRISPRWAPVMLVQGELDNVPGSSLELAKKAERELRDAGVKEVQLEIVPGEQHMFDLPPTVGRTDLCHRWEAVVKGLDWLCDHV